MPEEDIDTNETDFEEEEESSIESADEMKKRAKKSKTLGVLITVFIAVLVIMIGSLASYYYYNFQSQGSASQQSVRDSWNEVVLATMDLTNAFSEVEDFSGLVAEESGSFTDDLGNANRDLRDIFYGLQGTQSYVFSGNTFVSRLNNFLDDYLAYLRQLQRLIDRGGAGVVGDTTEVEELDTLNSEMNSSYDELLIADKDKIIEANLPKELFEMFEKVEGMVEDYLEEKSENEEAEEEVKAAAGGVVTKFMQAYIDRDGEAMKAYLTTEAEAEFNPAVVLEDLSEITNFKILDTRKISDTKIEIDARIDKETPDAKVYSESRLFRLLLKDDVWLIDSWATT